MNTFRNMSVARKMWVLFGGLLLCSAAVAGSLFAYLQAVDRQVGAAVQATDARVNLALRWQALTQQGVETALASVLSSEEQLIQQLSQKARGFMAQAAELQQQIQAQGSDTAEQQGLQAVEQARQAVLTHYDTAYKARDLGMAWEAQKAVEQDLQPAAVRYVQAQDAFIAHQQEQRAAAVEAGRQQRAWAEQLALGVALAMGLVGALLARALIRSITGPLAQAVGLAQAIAHGDLSGAPATERRDEMGALLQALAQMTEHLRGVVGEVRGGVVAVASASSQMAQGNDDLSLRTAQTVEQLQATTASIDRMADLVAESAESARHADQRARSAAASAAQGGSVVQEVVHSMQHIVQSSQQVGAIVGVIDAIAFQTNILALNAAVEAARAGAQGRGFAVVATEVRALAQRSAEAAKEIRALMQASALKVEAGTTLARRAGDSMEQIVQEVHKVSELIASITEAAGAQQDGIAHISQTMADLESVTAQNAGLVAQSTAAAQGLHGQALRLESGVARFRLESAAQEGGQAEVVQRARPMLALA